MIQEIAPFTLKAKVYQFSQFGKKWIFFPQKGYISPDRNRMLNEFTFATDWH